MFNVKGNENQNSYRRIKLVRNENVTDAAFGGTSFASSTINTYLNGEYYNSLNNSAKKMIMTSAWHVGGIHDTQKTSGNYTEEIASVYYAKVGMLTRSDIGYASNPANHYSINLIQVIPESWFKDQTFWTINMCTMPYREDEAYAIIKYNSGGQYYWTIASEENTVSTGVRPSVSLSPTVSIIAGNGTEDKPFELGYIEETESYGETKVAGMIAYNTAGYDVTTPDMGILNQNTTSITITNEINSTTLTGFQGWSTEKGGSVVYQPGDTVEVTDFTNGALTLYPVIETAQPASCFVYDFVENDNFIPPDNEEVIMVSNAVGVILNTSDANMTTCKDYMMLYYGNTTDYSDAQDGYDSFCRGNGTMFGGSHIINDQIVTMTGYNQSISFLGVVEDYTIVQSYYEMNNESDGIIACKNYLYNMYGEDISDAGDGFQSYCEGTGTVDGFTIKEDFDDRFYDNLSVNSFVENGFLIELGSDLVVEIIEYDDTCGTSVAIPRKIEGVTVTRISDFNPYPVFYNKNIETVIIPDTIQYIGKKAFISNPLVSVEIKGAPTLMENCFYANSQEDGYVFETFKYGGTCSYLNSVSRVFNQSYEPQIIITNDNNACNYNNYPVT